MLFIILSTMLFSNIDEATTAVGIRENDVDRTRLFAIVKYIHPIIPLLYSAH